MWKTLRSAAPGMQSDSNFGLSQARIFAGGKPHVAGEHELAACTSNTASNFGDADDARSGEPDKRIREDGKT